LTFSGVKTGMPRSRAATAGVLNQIFSWGLSSWVMRATTWSPRSRRSERHSKPTSL